MKPIVFPEANDMLTGSTNPPVADLPIYRDESGIVVSCWELDADEVLEVLKTRRVWFLCSGPTHQPIAIEGIMPIEVVAK